MMKVNKRRELDSYRPCLLNAGVVRLWGDGFRVTATDSGDRVVCNYSVNMEHH